MDTVMTISAFGPQGEEAVAKGRERIEGLNELLSTGSETSEVSKLNANGGGSLSADTNFLAGEALRLYEETEGAFDISIYPLMKLWGFDRLDELTEENAVIPTDEEIRETLRLVDAGSLSFDREKGELSYGIPGMAVDFGGITKGYASDSVIRLMRDMGVSSALLNLGGNVQALGKKPDGSLWKVGIQYPEPGSSKIAGVVSISDCAVITSGDYERMIPGTEYHHIIDPKTGWPVENGLRSVTVVAKDGTLADGLSTSLFVMGMEEALSFWREGTEDFEAVFLTEDQTLYVTEGLAESFTPSEGFEMKIIRKS
ncbi:MAG: FAD:protein FMN transferase [Bacteroidales bacterium]|nr:FAD:protein FMN transferase [Bacteroidales bacterium]